MWLQQQAYARKLELEDAYHGDIVSRREQVRLQEDLSMKEKVLRDTRIRKTHETGEMNRAQELRIDEVSMQKLRENHETIQQLTPQLQEMQEQMNSVNDSGEFQEVESNHSGRLSYVPSQPVPCRDKRLPLDTWNQSGLQETFLEISVLRLTHPQIILKEFTHAQHQERKDQFHKQQGQGFFSQEMTNKPEAQFRCRHLQEGRRP